MYIGKAKQCQCCKMDFIAQSGEEYRAWCDWCNKRYRGTDESGKPIINVSPGAFENPKERWI